jgi:hypothetical protein
MIVVFTFSFFSSSFAGSYGFFRESGYGDGSFFAFSFPFAFGAYFCLASSCSTDFSAFFFSFGSDFLVTFTSSILTLVFVVTLVDLPLGET